MCHVHPLGQGAVCSVAQFYHSSESTTQRPSRNMPSFNRMLVRAVKKHSALWDQHTKFTKKAGAREAAWAKIAFALEGHVDLCQTRWRTLRDTYLKRKRGHVATTGQWDVLEKEMTFLDNYRRPRTGVVLCPAAIKTEPMDEESREEEPSPPVVPGEVKFRLPQVQPLLPPQQPPAPAVAEQRRSDSEELFCLSLVPALQRLPPRVRSESQVKMLQVLHESELQSAPNGNKQMPPWKTPTGTSSLEMRAVLCVTE